jgi:hypothetical protein
MGTLILVLVILGIGIWIGFMIGFSKAMFKVAARMQRPKRPVIAWVIIAMACICLVIAAGSSLHSWRFVSTAARTTGTVTELRDYTDRENGGTSYAPTFSFRDSGGVEHSVASSLYSSPPQHRVGDTLPVLYRPNEPTSARVDGYWYLWGMPTVTGILGGLYLPVGIVILFWPRIAARIGRILRMGRQ